MNQKILAWKGKNIILLYESFLLIFLGLNILKMKKITIWIAQGIVLRKL